MYFNLENTFASAFLRKCLPSCSVSGTVDEGCQYIKATSLWTYDSFRLFCSLDTVHRSPFTVPCPLSPPPHNTPSGQLTPSMLQSKFMILLLQHLPGSSTPLFTILLSLSASYPQDHFQPPFSVSLILLHLTHIQTTNQAQYFVQQWHMHSL